MYIPDVTFLFIMQKFPRLHNLYMNRIVWYKRAKMDHDHVSTETLARFLLFGFKLTGCKINISTKESMANDMMVKALKYLNKLQKISVNYTQKCEGGDVITDFRIYDSLYEMNNIKTTCFLEIFQY